MSTPKNDRRVVLWILGVMVALVAVTAVFAPNTQDDDPQPTTYNSGAQGWKGAYLLLRQLNYDVRRSEQSAATALDAADAPHTTYLLAAPNASAEDVQKQDYEAVERFLRRGGRVIATGVEGASFLPGGRSGRATQFVGALCNIVTEGNGALTQAGSVSTYDAAPWSAAEPLARVDARCGADAVMVHRDYAHGGRMIYLSSSEPFSNRGLRQDNALHLLLLAVGPATGADRRTVLFDEFYHGEPVAASDYLKGLPIRSLVVQASLLLFLLVVSYTRRSGPIREPLPVPRTSPLEFASSMGALYERAGTTQPATDAARRRLISFLMQQYGISAEIAAGSSQDVAGLVATRAGVDAAPLAQVLERAGAGRYETLRPRDALALVRSIDDEIKRLRAAAKQTESRTMETK